jgi:hypothetical protein
VVRIKIIHNWTPSSELFHNRLLCHCTVVATNVVCFVNASNRGTVMELGAAIIFCVSLIGGTFFVYCIEIFKEKSLENRPTTLTTLIHEVALQEVLCRQIFCLPKPYSDTRL